MKNEFIYNLGICSFLAISFNQAFATDVSLTNVGFASRKVELGTASTKESKMALGAEVESRSTGALGFYGFAEVEMLSYSGDLEPDDATNFIIGGGARHYFTKINETFVPYIGAFLSFNSSKVLSDENLTGPVTQTDTTGIFYGAGAGLRMNMGNLSELDMSDVTAFINIEARLFDNALSATTKSKSFDGTGAETDGLETSTTSLALDTFSGISDMTFGLGISF